MGLLMEWEWLFVIQIPLKTTFFDFSKYRSKCVLCHKPDGFLVNCKTTGFSIIVITVCLYCNESERESDVASRWVHMESNCMFTLSSDKG